LADAGLGGCNGRIGMLGVRHGYALVGKIARPLLQIELSDMIPLCYE